MACRFRHGLGCIATAGMVIASASLALAVHSFDDDRKPSRLPMVGTLTIERAHGTGVGTAALIDNCGILTNFHVAFGPWYVTVFAPPSHGLTGRFELGAAAGPGRSAPVTTAIPVVWGDYRGPDRAFRRPQEDWAYLVLERCLGEAHGHLDIGDPAGPDGPVPDGSYMSVGFSSGVQLADPACSVASQPAPAGPAGLVHDCITLPGDSGGPILRRGTHRVHAIASRTGGAASDGTCALRLPAIEAPPQASVRLSCGNLAVPLTARIVERIAAAQVAAGTQRALLALGYDAGPLGAITDPRLAEAIRSAQRDMGWPVTGQPSHALHKILAMRRVSS